MLYFKTSQVVPGKGDAWMYYACDDEKTVQRYMTFIPATGELDKVPNPFIKKLQRPEMLQPCSEEEFHRLWPPDEHGGANGSNSKEAVQRHLKEKGISARKHFDPNMTILEAMSVHPKVAEVFAAFHLGGCSSCGISEIETVAQVCMGYGVDVDMLLDVLEGVMEDDAPESGDEAADDDSEAVAKADSNSGA